MAVSITHPNTCRKTSIRSGLYLAFTIFDLQRDTHAAYKHDRGPVTIYSVRPHVGIRAKLSQLQYRGEFHRGSKRRPAGSYMTTANYFHWDL